ncbi:MAG: copper chaperone PCu(A)C [Parvularculaceae bacterium]|nr:copper chaperone PCu(A)C [Parvularculaceae bacterium]
MRATTALIALLALAACAERTSAPTGKTLSCEAREGGAVTLSGAWLREQKDASGMSAAYFTLCNGSMSEVTIAGLSTPAARLVELHETTRDANGVASMAPVGEIALKPGELVQFEPGGKHAMLMSLSAPIIAGDRTNLVLQFADGSTVSAEAVAKSAAEAAGRDGH